MAKWVLKVAKHAAIGATGGYAAGRIVSDAMGAEVGGHKGAQVGAVVGAATGLPFGKMAKGAANATKIFAAGLEATQASKIGAGIRNGKVIYRRIHGRIVRFVSKV